MSVCVYLYATCVGVLRGQKRVPGILELELEPVVSYLILRTELRSSGRT